MTMIRIACVANFMRTTYLGMDLHVWQLQRTFWVWLLWVSYGVILRSPDCFFQRLGIRAICKVNICPTLQCPCLSILMKVPWQQIYDRPSTVTFMLWGCSSTQVRIIITNPGAHRGQILWSKKYMSSQAGKWTQIYYEESATYPFWLPKT